MVRGRHSRGVEVAKLTYGDTATLWRINLGRRRRARPDVLGFPLDQDKGYFPDKWHQPNFIDCVRSRARPNAEIEKVYPSACLVHLANTSYRVGQKQLMFDAASERYTNRPITST